MDEKMIRKQLYEKYGSLFKRYTQENAYIRLWLLYRELSVTIEAEYVPNPNYDVVLMAFINKNIVFKPESVRMIEDNSLWNLHGFRFIEDSEDGTYFGRLIMLIVGHYGLSISQIQNIAHISDPEYCLICWSMYCVYNGWACAKRLDLSCGTNSWVEL